MSALSRHPSVAAQQTGPLLPESANGGPAPVIDPWKGAQLPGERATRLGLFRSHLTPARGAPRRPHRGHDPRTAT
jgi:hypothetical protein